MSFFPAPPTNLSFREFPSARVLLKLQASANNTFLQSAPLRASVRLCEKNSRSLSI